MYLSSNKFPEKCLVEIQKFVARVSSSMAIGSLQLVSDDRVIRAYAAIDVEDASFEPAHIQNLLNACVHTLSKSLPNYMDICFGGKTVEEVFAVDEVLEGSE